MRRADHMRRTKMQQEIDSTDDDYYNDMGFRVGLLEKYKNLDDMPKCNSEWSIAGAAAILDTDIEAYIECGESPSLGVLKRWKTITNWLWEQANDGIAELEDHMSSIKRTFTEELEDLEKKIKERDTWL